MNTPTLEYIEKLKHNEDVLGIILFGSWARGNNREDSDVDLVIIKNEGFERVVDSYEGQVFEIIYTTEKLAFEFWENNKDQAYDLWDTAKIIYDRDGSLIRLKQKALKMLNQPKQPIEPNRLEQLKFDAEDQLRYIKHVSGNDPTSAALLLNKKAYDLINLYFDIQGLWTPAPKQVLDRVKIINPDLYELFVDFYKESRDLHYRIEILGKIIDVVFVNR